MRAILAGLFIFGLTLAFVAFIGSLYPDGRFPWWAIPGILIVLFGSMFGSLFIFNKRGFRPNLSAKSHEEQIEELKQKGLLISESFAARRAFQLEEFEDEGSHYFIELSDGRTLYLNGQYLYDFEPIEDDPELNQPRRFPCTEFTVLRHKEAGYVVDILCSGTVLEPELLAPHFDEKDWKHAILDDGVVIADKSYEQIKRERAKA
jgi:hypothetical protein